MLKRALLFVLLLATVTEAKGRFRPGDWVTYGNFRYVTSVAVGFSHVYFGTTEGVLRFDRNRQVFELPLTKADGLPDNYIRALAYDRLTDQVYAATPQGGAYFLPAFGEWYAATFPDSLGNQARPKLPFLLPHDFGLRYSGDGQLTDNNFRSFRFTDWEEDGFNNLWLGSWGLGPFLADERSGNLERLPFGLLTSRVSGLLIGNNEVWFACMPEGADRGGLVRWSSKDGSWNYFEAGVVANFAPQEIQAIAGNKNYIFLGTEDGIVRFERKTGFFRPTGRKGGLRGEQILSLFATESGLFAGTRYGVYAVDLKGDSVWNLTSPSISGGVINDLKMAGGYLWAATNRGLYRLAAGEKTWKRFSDPEQITPSTIRTLALFDGYLWAGGIRGLAKINTANDSTEGWRTPAGAADLDVYALGANGKYVWAAVRAGVYQFDFASREWEFLSELDGLASNEIYQIQADGDYVWFATDEGASRFYWNAPYLRK